MILQKNSTFPCGSRVFRASLQRAGRGWLAAGCCKAARLLGAGPPGSPSPGNRFGDSALDLQVPKPTVQIPNLTRHDGAAGGMGGGDVGTKDGPNIYTQIAMQHQCSAFLHFSVLAARCGGNIPPSHLHKNWGAELAHQKTRNEKTNFKTYVSCSIGWERVASACYADAPRSGLNPTNVTCNAFRSKNTNDDATPNGSMAMGRLI
jgi:hypothetical protein